jgi:ABC-type cobalamin/Fe3+-siderophores transport system ATPase subunit
MAETIWTYPEQITDIKSSIRENNDSDFSNSKEKIVNPNKTLEDMQKSKAYGVLSVLDSQWENISKEDAKTYIAILEKKDIKFLNELSKKSKNEIKQFLIQAQIDELEARGFRNLSLVPIRPRG